MNTNMNIFGSLSFLSSAALGLTLMSGLAGCDLPKDIGDETASGSSGGESDTEGDTASDSMSGSDSESDTNASDSATTTTTTTDPGMCAPGDMMDADDGCNTCICDDSGNWACTEIACDPPNCEPGESANDGCNTCTCGDDGEWQCTDVVCEPECEPGDTTQMDCNDCFCDEFGNWACDDQECPAFDPFTSGEAGVCQDDVPVGGLSVLSSTFEGNTLVLQVEHGGGCEDHFYGGCWTPEWAESAPVQTNLDIAHSGQDDPCDSIVQAEVQIDITPILDSYVEFYGDTGSFIINIGGGESIEYTL